jgi:phosphoglycolate phosphatase
MEPTHGGRKSGHSGADCYGKSGMAKGEMLKRMTADHSLKNPVYVGDTASDEKAAALFGMDFIHVAWGFGRPEGTHPTVRSFSGLLDYLERDNGIDG